MNTYYSAYSVLKNYVDKRIYECYYEAPPRKAAGLFRSRKTLHEKRNKKSKKSC